MSVVIAQEIALLTTQLRETQRAHPLRPSLVALLRWLWLPYALASVLILIGFSWGLPDGHYVNMSFQADENAAVWAVNQIGFPFFYPRWLPWGTALFYQVYIVKMLVTAGGIIHLSDLWIYVAGRLVVFASAIGAITLTFLLGKRLFDAWTGWLAATLLSAIPGFVIGSHYFKTDVPMICWSLAALLAACELTSRKAASQVLVLGLLVGYSTSVKYSAAVLIPVGLLAVVQTRRAGGHSLSYRRYALGVAVGFFVGDPYAILNFPGFISAVRWVSANNTQGEPYYVARPPALIDYTVNVLPYALTWPILVVSACALVWLVFKQRHHLGLVWAFVLLYCGLLAADNTRLVRYTIPILPFAALFVAHLLRSLAKLRYTRVVALVGASCLLAYSFVFSLSYVQAFAQVDPRVQANQWIEAHISNREPISVSSTFYLDIPQLKLIERQGYEVGFSVDKLQHAPSPYLVLSDFGTIPYQEARRYYPEQQRFFDYVTSNYRVVASFENPQRILWVNSKSGPLLSQDWLHPNPRITILARK